MITIQYGKIEEIKPPRASVTLFGFGDECTMAAALVLSPAGQGKNSSVYFPLSKGDVVAILFDTDFPQNSLILGGVFGDGDTLPSNGDEATVRAKKVNLGASISASNSPAARADLVNQNLNAIKASINDIIIAFNAHTHVLGEAPTTGPNTIISTGYNPQSTNANSVVID